MIEETITETSVGATTTATIGEIIVTTEIETTETKGLYCIAFVLDFGFNFLPIFVSVRVKQR